MTERNTTHDPQVGDSLRVFPSPKWCKQCRERTCAQPTHSVQVDIVRRTRRTVDFWGRGIQFPDDPEWYMRGLFSLPINEFRREFKRAIPV